MKPIWQLVFVLFFLAACGAKPIVPATIVSAVPPAAQAPANPIAENPDSVVDDAFVTCYLVIADTSSDYFVLRQKMIGLNQKFRISIDTLGRYYNAKKNLIALPDNDEDEIFPGGYYPRREISDYLSLEYLGFYQDTAPGKTIALVRGIYGTEPEAAAALKVLQPQVQTAFLLKAQVYMGCMH